MSSSTLTRAEIFSATEPCAPRARRLVRAALEELGLQQLVDDAQLAVSELATNAALHARTEIEVRLIASADLVRIEVSDLSSVMPVIRSYGSYATTGRGLGLVAAVSDQLGVDPRVPVGKTVWFTMARTRPSSEPADAALGDWSGWANPAELADLLEGVDQTAPREPGATERHDEQRPAPRTTATLAGLPVDLWLAVHQYHDAALRELVLHRGGRDASTLEAWEWYAAADHAHAVLGVAVDTAVAAALIAGSPMLQLPHGHPAPPPAVPAHLDVVLDVAGDLPGQLAALQEALDDAARLSEAGKFLLPPPLAEVVALRDWCCDQVIAQVGGAPASPWHGELYDDRSKAGGAAISAIAAALAERMRVTHEALIVGDDNNRILAVSPALEELLGWAPGELVGRRLVTVIPPHLRQAHLAGFTRFQVTGVAHALGVELVLPVLHASGEEIMCQFLIERSAAPGGRSVYTAHLRRAEQVD